MKMDFEYDEEGTLVYGQIFIGICSLTSGAVDPTTNRDYGLLCTNIVNDKPCHSKIFGEVPTRAMIVCKVCGAMIAYRAIEESLQ